MSNEINVGAISEALNNKVDLNQLNTNIQGLEYVSGLSMPSSRYIDLTLGASGSSYTAPSNGYYVLSKKTNGTNQVCNLINRTSIVLTASRSPNSSDDIYIYLPARKGDLVQSYYSAGGTTTWFRFVYAEGAE